MIVVITIDIDSLFVKSKIRRWDQWIMQLCHGGITEAEKKAMAQAKKTLVTTCLCTNVVEVHSAQVRTCA